MNITIDSKAFKMIMDKLTFLEQSVKMMSQNNGSSKWLTETEAMAIIAENTSWKKQFYSFYESGELAQARMFYNQRNDIIKGEFTIHHAYKREKKNDRDMIILWIVLGGFVVGVFLLLLKLIG